MTKLTASSPVVRETAATERGRAIIVALHPSHIELRLKGLRESHFLAYDALLWRAIKNSAERQRSERIARKQEKRNR